MNRTASLLLIAGLAGAWTLAPRLLLRTARGADEPLQKIFEGSARDSLAGFVLGDPVRIARNVRGNDQLEGGGRLLTSQERLVQSDDWRSAMVAHYTIDGRAELGPLEQGPPLIDLPGRPIFAIGGDAGTIVAWGGRMLQCFDAGGERLWGRDFDHQLIEVRVSVDGSLVAVRTSAATTYISSSGNEVLASGPTEGVRLSRDGSWKAHFLRDAVELWSDAGRVARFPVHAGLPRDAAFADTPPVAAGSPLPVPTRFAYADRENLYLVDLEVEPPVQIGRMRLTDRTEFRSVTFSHARWLVVGALRVDSAAAAGIMVAEEECCAGVAEGLVLYFDPKAVEILGPWDAWRWPMKHWNRRTPKLRTHGKRVFVNAWQTGYRGVLP